ncbi:luciferase-like monooxygenase [Bacillus freudenreichii]|nr:luciferase-like monooxygenase [Bacillus freudenreichii]
MRLSVIDQSPIASNKTAREALMDSLKLAQEAERLGYTRYWIAEHHDLPGLACSAPEVMLGFIGGRTSTIRIGSGAVLLPHYKPYKVAEIYNMLATLFPGRIDIGVGRAPGGSAEATQALSSNFLQNVWKFPELVDELLTFINDDFQAENEHSKLSASPIPKIKPMPWILGTSEKSAVLAAKKGIAYNFGHFMSGKEGKTIVQKYIDYFQPATEEHEPTVIITANAICASTKEQAEENALCSLIWEIQKEKGEGKNGIPSIQEAVEYPLSVKEKETVEIKKKKMILGSPQEVKEKILAFQEQYEAHEIMINTNTFSIDDRIQSYKLIAKEMLS